MSKKSCLVISYGPTPTPKYQKVEGGGMRCWGLAQGLHSRGYEVTVAINENFPVDISICDDIHLTNWTEDPTFANFLNTFDAVIVSYSMGGPVSFIVDHISDHVTLILDCYVPIYIEVSARNSEDQESEYRNYAMDVRHWNKALCRGDYFLCANEPQKHMYMGALGALGIINPYSYRTNRIFIVPFGVERSVEIPNKRNPYLDLGIKKTDPILLWFGGLYPWFNILPLLDVVKEISAENSEFKFVIVGGKNPYNSHPDFVKQYEIARSFAVKKKLLNKAIYFVDWVDFDDRYNWYQHVKAVISINNLGEENSYSWRTRVMDFVGGELPMITNGGDPLSDSLITAGAAIKLSATDKAALYTTLKRVFSAPGVIQEVCDRLEEEKKKYFWDVVVDPIDAILSTKSPNPYLEEKIFRESIHVAEPLSQQSWLARQGRYAKKLLRAPRKVLGIAKRKGIKRSLKLVRSTISNRLAKTAGPRERRYYFFSHPIDFTGAPLVLMDIISDFSEHIKPHLLSVVYPGGERDLVAKLRKSGYMLDKMVMGIGSRVIHAQLGIKKDDFVLLNTVALYPNYRDYVLGLLDNGKLNHAVWFIHEDKPELRFDDLGLVARVKRLIHENKISIYVPSRQTAKEYNQFFETDSIKPVTLRVQVPKQYIGAQKASDFNTIRFMLSGTSTDGRKGQLLAISALAHFMHKYYDKEPKRYRDFHLTLIAVGKDDYVSSQIRSIGKALLEKHLTIHPTVPKDQAMQLTSKCNVTICSSLNETFALFVAEGMLMGHVILRNKSSGYHEQIKDGENGYLVDTMDIEKFADAIEKLLNKDGLSNSKLASMSQKSLNISKAFLNADYFDQLYTPGTKPRQ